MEYRVLFPAFGMMGVIFSKAWVLFWSNGGLKSVPSSLRNWVPQKLNNPKSEFYWIKDLFYLLSSYRISWLALYLKMIPSSGYWKWGCTEGRSRTEQLVKNKSRGMFTWGTFAPQAAGSWHDVGVGFGSSLLCLDFPGGSDGKASVYDVGDLGSIPVGKIPWRRKWQSTPVLLPGKSHGQRSLVGYSLWGCKESDTTEWLHFHLLCLLGNGRLA